MGKLNPIAKGAAGGKDGIGQFQGSEAHPQIPGCEFGAKLPGSHAGSLACCRLRRTPPPYRCRGAAGVAAAGTDGGASL